MPRGKKVRDEEAHAAPVHVCLVYNPKDGRVVHVHEFFGKSFEPKEYARMALDTVASLGFVRPAGLKVLHAPTLKTKPGTVLRVNPSSLKIIVKKRADRGSSKR